MMKNSLVAFAFSSIFVLTGQAQSENLDPVITEKSMETFDLEIDGLTLKLPIELKSRALPEKISEQETNLSIGNVDILYQMSGAKENQIVKGWVEIEGSSFRCDPSTQIKGFMSALLKGDRDEVKVKRFISNKFDGYVVGYWNSTKGQLSGVNFQVMDGKTSKCFSMSLAFQDFEAYGKQQIKASISPLTDAINKSFVDHANQ